ncbi:unnamed protein product, partial [Symbiodinium sp. KB8]
SYIRGFIRPVLQGDFSLLETYVPSSLEKLSVPLCALCAIGDRRCRPEQLSAWHDVADAGFQERWFQNVWKPEFWSTEHRYIVDNPKSEDLPVLGCPGGAEDTGIDGPRVSDFGEDSAPESAPAVAFQMLRRFLRNPMLRRELAGPCMLCFCPEFRV